MAQPQFFEIKQPNLVVKIIEVVCRNRLPMTLWFKGQAARFETKFGAFYVSTNRFQVPLSQESYYEQFTSGMTVQDSKEVMGSFYLDNVNFFFSTEVLDLPANKIASLMVPPAIFKMQRRTFLRIPFPRHIAPKVTLFDPTKEVDPKGLIHPGDILQYRMLDLSVGGFAIAAKPEERDRFIMGSRVIDIQFKLKDVQLIATGKIRFAKEMMNDLKKPMLKVGIQFDKLKPQYEQVLAQFALEESRKMFTLLF